MAAGLAVHFECGHDTQRAIQYRQQAGQNALRRSAHQEAIVHLTTGLELLKALPDSPERTQQELFLQTTLGQALMATKGYSASEVERTSAWALELCRQVGESPQLFLVLLGLYAFYHARREFQTTGLELAEQMMRLAQNLQNPDLLLMAHLALGIILYWRGEFASARTLLEQGLSFYDPQHPPPVDHADLRTVDCLCHASWTLRHLGSPDQALKRSQEALA